MHFEVPSFTYFTDMIRGRKKQLTWPWPHPLGSNLSSQGYHLTWHILSVYKSWRLYSFNHSRDMFAAHTKFTSLRCRWQTSATQCPAPTVLYTNADRRYDKLVTDDGHQFTTLTVHLSWQHLRRLAIPEIWLVPTKI